jgi:hypothetical protein
MKLSFSFSKHVPPKREAIIETQNEHVEPIREVVEISRESGVVLEKTALDTSDSHDLVIEVKTHYSTPHGRKRFTPRRPPHDNDLVLLSETVSGIIKTGIPPLIERKRETSSNDEQPSSKRTKSILMQLAEARTHGFIQDAPDEEKPRMDPDQFGWALMRGMGYDASLDSSPSVRTTVSNHDKAGLGAVNRLQPDFPNIHSR